MRTYFGNTLAVILLLFGIPALANDSSYIRFIFDSSLTAAKFQVTIYDGINEHKIDLQNTQSWNGELFSPFGFIILGYKNSDTSSVITKVFFKKGRSEVSLASSSIPGQFYALDEKSSVNVIPYNDMGGAKYDAFKKEKEDVLLNFYYNNRSSFGKDPALVNKAFTLSDSLTAKKLEFINQFPDLYISFWVFISEMFRVTPPGPEKLLELYDTKFPVKFKSSKAGRYVESTLRNKVAIASNGLFPDFSVSDINNNRIESSKLRGRYVLIQFWASWCIPCIKEIPDLKKMNDRYNDSTLTIISFSIDKDASAFRKAVEKHAMNWPQVYGDTRLYNSLAYLPIPQLYLIDPEGHTIYNSTGIVDTDLTLLKKLVSDRLK
ncbi:TlpA disulfide reductase family protein [Chitinophaga sp. YIM B06452]|uniref:TlpA family protein disulfide reductase n=1 Tax=Chitinophaga sp. YIM B06452 TaxID=3082158 RepID=UPI0031FEF468